MLDDPDVFFEVKPSFVLRPRPSYYDGPEPSVLLGGKPQLPPHLDWPSGLSFYAQINLAKVPLSLDFEGRNWHSDLPDRGTLFVFLPLEDPYDGRARVLYCEEDVSDLLEAEPIDNIPDLRAGEKNWGSYWVDPVGLSDCGRFLYRQRADLLPFLSAYSVNGLWANLEEEAGNPAYIAQNKSTKALEAASLAAAFTAHPLPPAIDTAKVCSGYGAHDRNLKPIMLSALKSASMNWEFVFEFSRKVVEDSQMLANQYVLTALRDGDFGPRRVRYLEDKKDRFSERWREVYRDTHQPKSKTTLREKLRAARALRRARRKNRFDDRAAAWMEVARHRSGPVSADIAADVWTLVDEIHEFKVPKRSKLNLTAIDRWIRETQLGSFDVRQIGKAAMKISQQHLAITNAPGEQTGALPHEIIAASRDKDLADRYWDEKVREELTAGGKDGPHNFSIGPQKTQVLGAPFAVQPQVDELAESRVMLFQIADNSGMQINPPDGNFQLWTRPEDLKNRAFDKTIWTYFYS